MGAWDVGVWDNDDAADWLFELQESSDLSVLEAALSPEEVEGYYLEAPAASLVLCAADVILAALQPSSSTVPVAAAAWVKKHRSLPFEKLRTLAATKLRRVLAKDSELQQLWEENVELYSKWKLHVESMEQSLGS